MYKTNSIFKLINFKLIQFTSIPYLKKCDILQDMITPKHINFMEYLGKGKKVKYFSNFNNQYFQLEQ